jgi:hypothetical protein
LEAYHAEIEERFGKGGGADFLRSLGGHEVELSY